MHTPFMPESASASALMHAKNSLRGGQCQQIYFARKSHRNGVILPSLENAPNSSSIPQIQYETQGRYPVRCPEWQKYSQEACKDQYDSYLLQLSPQPRDV
jgi:hypothetical protein